MKKSHKIYDEYSTDLEINDSSPLYKSWNDKWLNYLKNLNGLYENQSLKDIKFNVVEHYTEDGLEEFIAFAIKIRMQGINSSEPPRLKDLRAIALAT